MIFNGLRGVISQKMEILVAQDRVHSGIAFMEKPSGFIKG
jgi:hypothetical protein